MEATSLDRLTQSHLWAGSGYFLNAIPFSNLRSTFSNHVAFGLLMTHKGKVLRVNNMWEPQWTQAFVLTTDCCGWFHWLVISLWCEDRIAIKILLLHLVKEQKCAYTRLTCSIWRGFCKVIFHTSYYGRLHGSLSAICGLNWFSCLLWCIISRPRFYKQILTCIVLVSLSSWGFVLGFFFGGFGWCELWRALHYLQSTCASFLSSSISS